MSFTGTQSLRHTQLQRPHPCLGRPRHHLCSLPPEIPKPIWRQLSVAHRMLNVAVPKPRLQRPCVVPLVRKLVTAACRSMWGWIAKGMPARSPRRWIRAWKLFGAIGAPRSETKT